MAGHRPFSELIAKMSTKAQKEVKRGTGKILAEMELAELREALTMRQADLAQKLKITQAAVSRLERRDNVTIASLKDYVEALGGRLELNAVLPSHTVKITYALKEHAVRIGEITIPIKAKSASKVQRKRKVSRTHPARVNA
jgi:transcriptional regulator with XRE-family HTH domain